MKEPSRETALILMRLVDSGRSWLQDVNGIETAVIGVTDASCILTDVSCGHGAADPHSTVPMNPDAEWCDGPSGVTFEAFTEDEVALIIDALTSLFVRAPGRRAAIKSFLETQPTFGIEVEG